MCGIFGYVGQQKNAGQIVFQGLKDLEYRGYDSWGVAVIHQGQIHCLKKIGKIGQQVGWQNLPSASLAFGHTRWATHGGVTLANAHPHLDCQQKIAVIHNGIIENYALLKKDLLKKGHRFVSETDSEAATHLIEEYHQKTDLFNAVCLAFQQFVGFSALIVLSTQEEKLIAVRQGSPLVIGFGQGENFIASDPSALLAHTRLVYFLKENEAAIIQKDKVQVFDLQTKQSQKIQKIKINWQAHQTNKGQFPYFMLKEIHEQPKIIREIAQSKSQEVKKLTSIIKKAQGVYLIGCGTASYISLAGTYLFSKIAQKHINAAIGSEFSYHLEFLNQKSLIIALSQSGETMDILESVRKAKNKGAKVFALVNVMGSTLYREADYQMLIGAGPEKAVASTKASTAKLAHLLLLAYTLAQKSQKGRSLLRQAAQAVANLLLPEAIKRIQKLAQKLKNSQHLLVLGRGLSYPASLETSLKIKEISYLHAEGLPAGELKHGPLALIEKNTPCIAFLPNDETYGANLAAALEVKARGGFLIGVSFQNHEIFDYYIPVADVAEATIIPNIVFGQLLAYYLTLAKGLDPDKPRNLAKSVTVK